MHNIHKSLVQHSENSLLRFGTRDVLVFFLWQSTATLRHLQMRLQMCLKGSSKPLSAYSVSSAAVQSSPKVFCVFFVITQSTDLILWNYVVRYQLRGLLVLYNDDLFHGMVEGFTL